MNDDDLFYKRRPDLPDEVANREHLLRRAIQAVESYFPTGTGIALLAFDFGKEGQMSWISNGQREDMIKALREMANRLESGLADTAGREG